MTVTEIILGLVVGLVVGVGAGLVLSLIAQIQKMISRCQQIKFIRKFLICEFTKLANVQDPISANEGETAPSADQFRFGILEGSLRDLQAIVDHRTVSMRNAQLYDLYRVLSFAKDMHDRQFRQIQKYPKGMVWYRTLYERFAGFKWLGLPKNSPWK